MTCGDVSQDGTENGAYLTPQPALEVAAEGQQQLEPVAAAEKAGGMLFVF